MSLFKNNNSINGQAKAVLAYLETYDGIESSWDDKEKEYKAEPAVAEWHNGRERGYVIYLRFLNGNQLNVIFFEHRNSDEICAVHWYQNTGLNPPTISTAEFGVKYKDKFDIDITVPWGEAGTMAAQIMNLLENEWSKNTQ